MLEIEGIVRCFAQSENIKIQSIYYKLAGFFVYTSSFVGEFTIFAILTMCRKYVYIVRVIL